MRFTRKRLLIFLFFAILIMVVILYTIIDNNRFKVVRQDVVIPELPLQFEGYTILQISDLHSQQFGKNDIDLITAINNLDYDLIAVTGDVQSHYNRDLQPVFNLLDDVNQRDGLLCTSGNVDPYFVDFYIGQVTVEGKTMQSHGCTLLDRPFFVERDGARIWFSELFDDRRRESWRTRQRPAGPLDVNYDPDVANALHAIYKAEIDDIFSGITADSTLIGITHYPVTQAVLDDPTHDGMLPFDLILAGHYHGGQFRVPFVGALYVPIPSNRREGLFPDQRIVSGLYTSNGMQQYVSRGLGAGGPVPLLSFRLFNTPEINLLTLHRQIK
jgi:predicted MPP superfamily phosphohydrolase